MDAAARLAAAGNLLLGGWLIATPFVFAASGVARWNNVLVGIVVVLLASYNYTRVRSRRPAIAIGAGLVALLGCWLVVAPSGDSTVERCRHRNHDSEFRQL